MRWNTCLLCRVIFANIFVLFLDIRCFCTEGISLVNQYQQNSTYQYQLALDSLTTFNFKIDDKVLDIGCGDGRITFYISSFLLQGCIIGLDISDEMISYATSTYPKGNLLFIHQSATQVPFKEQFDKIVSFNALHWVENQKEALLSMKNSLKAHGEMLLLIPLKSVNNLSLLAKEVIAKDKWKPHFPNFKITRSYHGPDEYLQIFDDLNLEVVKLNVFESEYCHQNKQSLIMYLQPLITFIDHLTPTLQKQFVEDIANQMIFHNEISPKGEIIAINSFIETIVQKK